jgi:prepilin-type processing-associated H-X9-DG protein
VTGYTNFDKIGSLSYSIATPYFTNNASTAGYRWNNNLGPEFALMADMNPGVIAENSAKSDNAASLQKTYNSKNHGQDGQNVLFGDGHVNFEMTSFCGTNHDGIYNGTAVDPGNGTRTNNGANSLDPTSDGDSILLPVANGTITVQ